MRCCRGLCCTLILPSASSLLPFPRLRRYEVPANSAALLTRPPSEGLNLCRGLTSLSEPVVHVHLYSTLGAEFHHERLVRSVRCSLLRPHNEHRLGDSGSGGLRCREINVVSGHERVE